MTMMCIDLQVIVSNHAMANYFAIARLHALQHDFANSEENQ
jgi:hypothetical protein